MAEGKEKKGFFKRLVSGLTKTRDNIVSGFDSIFSGFSHIDDDFYEELEEILVMGDIGIRATEEIIENLKQKVKENHIKEPADCRELLINSIKEQMYVGDTAYRFEEEKSVVLVIGVNGVGKTTTVGKLAGKLKNQGKKVVLGCSRYLPCSGRRPVNGMGESCRSRHRSADRRDADPGSVVYDAVAGCESQKGRCPSVRYCRTAS